MSLVAPGLGHVVMGLTARGLSWLVSYIAFALLVGAERPLALVAVVVAAAGDAIVMGASLPDGRAADADGD